MSMQAFDVEVTLFGEFTIKINGIDVTPEGGCREFLALMFAHKGEGVTAKRYWELVFKDTKVPFTGGQFTKAHMEALSYLKESNAEHILKYSLRPMRSCSIDCDKVHCDYYRMLQGEIPFGKKEDFLPEYKWAPVLYKKAG